MIGTKEKIESKLIEKFLNKSIDEETLSVSPLKDVAFKNIYLTKNKSAWLTIEWLSEELKIYAQNHYKKLFNLHPENRGKIVMYNEEIESERWHRSYLKTPARNPDNIKSSYMYSGLNFYDDLSLPQPFQNFLDFLNELEENEKYNQVTVNWYANGNDFIAAHSDCRIGMKPASDIAIVTLCDNQCDTRELQFIAKPIKKIESNAIYKMVKIETKQGCIIKMHGDTQLKFRHKVPKSPNIVSSRISLSFRKIYDEH